MDISEKDLLYISDLLGQELLAMKKCNHYTKECQDTDVIKALNTLGNMHKNHYQQLLDHLHSTAGNGNTH